MAQDVKSLVLSALSEQIAEANKHAEAVQSATVDKGKLVHEIRESSDDPAVVKFREWFEKAEAAIEAKVKEIHADIEARLLPSANGDVNVEEEKAKYSALKDEITAAKKYLKTLQVTDEQLGALPDLKTLRGGTAGKGTGEGGKRPRLSEVKVDGEKVFTVKENKDGTKTESATFTATAAYVSKKSGAKVAPKDLQESAFSAAKTDDLKTLNGTPFDFYFSAGEGDKAQNFHIEVVPAVPTSGEDDSASE